MCSWLAMAVASPGQTELSLQGRKAPWFQVCMAQCGGLSHICAWDLCGHTIWQGAQTKHKHTVCGWLYICCVRVYPMYQ